MLDLPAIETEARALASTDARMAETLLALCARVRVLDEALISLVSWFPDEPCPPEWRLKGGDDGADDAVAFARAALWGE